MLDWAAMTSPRRVGRAGRVRARRGAGRRAGMEFFATHHDFVVIWRREAIEGGGRLEDAMAEHMRPFLERAVAFLEREVAAGRLREHDPVELMQLVYGAVSTYFSDAGFRARLSGERPDDAGGARALRRARSPRCCGTHWRRVEPAGAERLAVDHRVRGSRRALIAAAISGSLCERAVEVLGGDLEPAHDPVVADPQDREAERPARCARRGRSGAASRGRRRCRTGSATPGRVSRASPRSGARGARASSRTCAFVTSCSGCTTPCSAAAFRPGAPVALVVCVGAGEQRVHAAGSARCEHVVELGLAEVAAVAAVGAVAGRGRARWC